MPMPACWTPRGVFQNLRAPWRIRTKPSQPWLAMARSRSRLNGKADTHSGLRPRGCSPASVSVGMNFSAPWVSCPAESGRVPCWPAFCFKTRIFCSLTSQPTIWIWRPSPGWKVGWATGPGLSWSSLTTATSSTMSSTTWSNYLPRWQMSTVGTTRPTLPSVNSAGRTSRPSTSPSRNSSPANRPTSGRTSPAKTRVKPRADANGLKDS